jgi:hypothetical protein
MKPGTPRIAAALLIALAAAAPAAADETYVGMVTVPEGGPPVALTVTVRQYTSDERANELAQMLHARGHSDVAAALAKDRIGEVRLGDGRFHLTLARQEPTVGGRVLRLVTDRPLHASAKAPAPAPPADAVGYVELTLDAKDAGAGRLHPAIRARFDAEGFVAPESLSGAPWPITGVKRQP